MENIQFTKFLYRTECVAFCSNFMKYKKNNHYNKVFNFSLLKYKLENKNNIIPSIYESRSYTTNIKYNDWIEESHNDESICKSTAIIQYNNSDDNSNKSKIIKIDKRCKVNNADVKKLRF